MLKSKRRPTNGDHGEILRWLTDRQREMVACVRELVLRESPTQNKLAATHCAHTWRRVRAHRRPRENPSATLSRRSPAGDFARREGSKPVLLLGHFDTVYDVGTLRTMPWRERERPVLRAWSLRYEGRHRADDVCALSVDARFMAPYLDRSLSYWFQTKSSAARASRSLTEKIARQCAAVLVCEPSGPGGALKTARKGVGSFLVKVTGQAAHSGLDFEKGHSAILELAHQIQAISRLTDLKRGITLNVGVIRGGTRTNVIAAEAMAEVDLRIAKKADGAVMERKVRRLRPVNPKCKIEIEGGINRPPMERTKQVVALFELARRIANELGFPLAEIAVGGGSDGNFTAGIGIPTLDGLGAVGEGAHASHESIVAAELPQRAALLAGLIEAIE